MPDVKITGKKTITGEELGFRDALQFCFTRMLWEHKTRHA